jgi:hypothetical protein
VVGALGSSSVPPREPTIDVSDIGGGRSWAFVSAPQGGSPLQLPSEKLKVAGQGTKKFSPPVGSQPPPRWARGPLSVPCRLGTPVYKSKHDAHRRITQNRNAWEYGRNRNDLRNIIEDWRRIRDRRPSPPPRVLTRDVTPTGRSGFRALAGPLRDVRWPAKFMAGHIDRYDSSSNPEEFIQVYQTVIEAAGGDDRVKANFLPTALSGAAKSWLINLPEGSIHS